MSGDNKNSESFDFDFDSLNAEAPQASTGEGAFDLDNPFGDDRVTLDGGTSAGGSSFDLADSLGGDSVPEDFAGEAADIDGLAPTALEGADTIKKGGGKEKRKGGWFSKGKEKPVKEKKEKAKKEKKEKVVKEKAPAGEPVPRDWGTILCIAFSLFLLASLLMFNIAAVLSRGPESTIMQTLCFLGAFNIVGLAAAAVPILFYKFPKERTLPNVMLGIAAVATLSTILIAVTEFYRYGFILKP